MAPAPLANERRELSSEFLTQYTRARSRNVHKRMACSAATRRDRVPYDARTDTLMVVFRDVPIAESDEDKPSVILDYNATANIVSLEVLDASRRVEEPRKRSVETEG